jgi:hypothetical protein
MGLDLDKHPLEREEERHAEVAISHVKTLDHLVTPRVGQHGIFRTRFKALASKLLTASELADLSYQARR